MKNGFHISLVANDLDGVRALIPQKTVTYVLGTFVTLVPGPHTPFSKGEFVRRCFNPSLQRGARGDFVWTTPKKL